VIEAAVVPACPVYGTCGGCAYQHVPYEEELQKKESFLRGLFGAAVEPIVASPEPYHYRNRLDLALLRTKGTGETFLGFMPENRWKVISIDSCAIARREISDLLPGLKDQAAAKMEKRARFSNVIIKTGDDGRVRWGGVGRRSTKLAEDDYLWTEIAGVRVHYSLDTFFQANLAILPLVVARLESMIEWTPRTEFYDLYGGVGLFGLAFARRAGRVVIVESSKPSTPVARYNISYNRLANAELVEATVEDYFVRLMGSDPFLSDLSLEKGKRGQTPSPPDRVLFVDPPRRGLSEAALGAIADFAQRDVFYLSCNPESLARDAGLFAARGLRLERAVPFDFFPKTRHLETLAHFRKGN